MSWTPEMIAALEADGEKLRQLTGEDHGPWCPDELPKWIVKDVSPDKDNRVADIRFFAEDADHAKRQWFELMELGEDDPDVVLHAVPADEYFALRGILGDALQNNQE